LMFDEPLVVATRPLHNLARSMGRNEYSALGAHV
jgi:hypothetical protein